MTGSAQAPAIEWRGVRFRYPGAHSPALADIDLRVQRGEFVLIAGPTGCGKTTLLKTANGVIPRESTGTMEGAVTLFGRDTTAVPSPELRSLSGLLFQNPDAQLLCRTVEEETAFAPENLALPPEAIARRVERALSAAAATTHRFRRSAELSGGEKQRVALAGVLSLQPRILLLDEPTSQLDDPGTGKILAALDEIRSKTGATLIITEHRIERLLPLADRLVVMGAGKILGDFPKGAFLESLPLLRTLGIDLPPWMEIADRIGGGDAEGEEALCAHLIRNGFRLRLHRRAARPETSKNLIRVRGLRHRYNGAAPPALENLSMDLHGGEILALMGANGAGKTTLLHLLSGILPLSEGTIEWFGAPPKRLRAGDLAGRVGVLPQNPDLILSAETVREEIALGPAHLGFGAERAKEAVERSLALLRLSDLREKNPFALSQGERLRVALAAVLACEPDVLLLDEPTAGMDRGSRNRFAEDIRKWTDAEPGGRAAIICTHDLDVVRGCADRALLLDRGEASVQGPIPEVFRRAGRSGVAACALTRIAHRLGASETPGSIAELMEGLAHAG